MKTCKVGQCVWDLKKQLSRSQQMIIYITITTRIKIKTKAWFNNLDF